MNCQKPGALQTGGYIQFQVNPGSRISVNNFPYTPAAGDAVRMVIGSDGTGGIQIQGQISEFSFDDVTLYINGDYRTRETINSISVPGDSNLESTLTLVVPAQGGQALLKIDDTNLINGQDNRKITANNLQPNSDGILHLQDTLENRINYEGGASDYLIG